MSGMTDFEFNFTKPQLKRAAVRSAQIPERILVLGNFSGHKTIETEIKPISLRTIHALDIDTFDSVLARIEPRIHLEAVGDSGVSLDIEIDDLDDFHPDSLFQKLEIFDSLREMRQRLLDPVTFAAAAAELNPNLTKTDNDGDTGAAVVRDATISPDQPDLREDDAATLERLLGKKSSADIDPPSRRDLRGPGGGDMTAFIRDLVAPYIVPEADPRQEVYVESLDEAIRKQMGAVLHSPSFQAVESAWRGLSWLLTELELGEDLQLFVCDMTKEELLADLRGAAGRLEESEFYRLVIDKEIGTLGGRAWSLLLGDYYFGHSEDDVFLLAALGAIASRAGAPFLAGAKPEVLGCRSLADSPDPSAWTTDDPTDRKRWESLRKSLQASWLNLALPRILLRLPYGPQTDSIESFPFEELTSDPDHESFLWGNPAFACSLLFVRSLLGGSGSQLSESLALEGLPAFVIPQDGAKTLKPCAEVLLSERAGMTILARGLIPLLSHRDHNGVSIIRIQSLAISPGSLEEK